MMARGSSPSQGEKEMKPALIFEVHALKWATAVCLSAIASIPDSMKTLAIFVMLDFGTGLLAAVYNKSLCSERGMNGFIKKVMLLVVVSSLYVLEMRTGYVHGLANVTAWYFTVVEAISIVENYHKVGGILPPFLLKVLLEAKRHIPGTMQKKRAYDAGIILDVDPKRKHRNLAAKLGKEKKDHEN